MDRRRAGALLALAACIACSAAAPTASNHTALDLYDGAPEGCYYNFQHYGEGDRIMTNEPCLNCTCHNRMLMCYLRVCPFTKPIGQDCTIEKRADQCCPIVTCPDVPVDLLTSTSTTSPAEYGATGLGKLDKYGCSISGKYFPEGSKVPPTPNKPCEHCYCIRNMTTCVMQECTLHVDGCTPIYHKDVCCPVRYSCDHPEDEMPLLDDMSTTVRPTPGFLLTTTTLSPVTQMTQDCVHDDQIFADGASIKTEKACEHCYCMKGDIVCVVQECGTPMENEGKNCTSLPPREGQCCPDTYICEGDELGTELPVERTTQMILDIDTTTLSPPRRTGVEGSGYRNEPDEVGYTETPLVPSEHEGSGEEQESVAPYYTTEKSDSERPVTSEPITTEDLHTSLSTKSPLSGEPEDTTADIISGTEPEYIPGSSDIPIVGGDDTDTTEENIIPEDVTDKKSVLPHEVISTTLTSEIYDSITTESSETLNTVSDVALGHENVEPDRHGPATTAPSEDKLEESTSQDIPNHISDKEKPGYFYPSPTTSAGETMQEQSTMSATTEKESSVPDHYIPSTPSSSMNDEDEKIIPETHEVVTPSEVDKEQEKETEPDSNLAATISAPADKDEKATTEPDHSQNTVDVVEEHNVQQHGAITTAKTPFEVEDESTMHGTELGSGVEDITEENMLEVHEHDAPTSPSEGLVTTAEPDKGLNTIPDAIKETSPEAEVEITTLQQEAKLTTIPEHATIASESTISKIDHFTITTEPSFRKEDEGSVSTERTKAPEATTGRTDLIDEGFIPTSIQDEKLSPGHVTPSVEQEFTTSIPENEIESKEPTTESILEVSAPFEVTPEKLPELPIELGTEFISGTPTTEKLLELTTLSSEIEAHEEPARIPGEGDCLLNSITYRNNSVVPSTNNCHTGCKCVSSIIKCDPILCSAPPDYMHNCQSVYDSPDACCPTYVCDHPRETVPPQSDNQMSGTESPLPSPAIECRGDQCEIVVDTKLPEETSESGSDQCGPDGCEGVEHKPIDSKYPLEYPQACKDGNCALPTDCTDGKCEVPPHHKLVCDSHHGCRIVPDKLCDGEACKDSQVTPCEGASCKTDVPASQDTPLPCREEDGCKPEQSIPEECKEESCRRNEIPDSEHKLPSECKGPQCLQQTDTLPEDGIHSHSTETSPQERTTPFESVTENLESVDDTQNELPKTTDLVELPVSVTEQQPHIPETKKDIPTAVPDMLFTNEIDSQTLPSVGLPESETHIPDEQHTTSQQSYATETYTTDRIVPGIGEDKPVLTGQDSDKKETPPITEQTMTDATESYEHNISVTPMIPVISSEQDIKVPSSELLTTITNNIDHEYTTISYASGPSDVTKLETEPSTKLPFDDQYVGTQTEQPIGEHESSTKEPSYITTVENTQKTEATPVIDDKDHVEEEPISKATEATTEEEDGFTEQSDLEFPDKKPLDIEPVRIEPQEGPSTESQSPAVESTDVPSVISEPSEKENSETESPIKESHVPEDIDTKTEGIEPEVDVTEKVHITEENQTELPQTHDQDPGQHSTETQPLVTVSQQEMMTEGSPAIKEPVTEYSETLTTEAEKSFTEVEDAFVTGQDQITTEKLDHELVYIPTKSPELPEIDTKAPTLLESVTTENDVHLEPEQSSEEPTKEIPENIPVEIPENVKPESDVKDLSTQPQESYDFTNMPEIVTKLPILDVSKKEEETETDQSSGTETHVTFTEAPIAISTVSNDINVPVEDITDYIPVHLTTKTPEEFITDHEIGTEVPLYEYSKYPDTYETEIPQVSTQLFDISTKAPETISVDEDLGTGLPLQDVTESVDTTKIFVHESTTSSPDIKIPDDVKESEYGATGYEQIVTKTPDDNKEIQPEVLEGSVDTRTTPGVILQEEQPTKAPVFIEESEMGATRRQERPTKKPEYGTQSEPVDVTPEVKVTAVPESEQESFEGETKIPESTPEAISQEQEITKAPEFTKEAESLVTKQQEETTSAPTDVQPVPTINEIEKEITKSPEDAEPQSPAITPLDESITKGPEDSKHEIPDITSHDFEVNKTPEDINDIPHKQLTESPEETKESLPEITEHEEFTKPSEETKEITTEGISQEEFTKAPETTKESLPEILVDEEGVTKVPEENKEPVTEVTGQEEITKSPEDTKDSEFEVTEHKESVTKSPEKTTETVLEVTVQDAGVTESSEDSKEPVSDVTGHEHKVTQVPEVPKESIPEIIAHEEETTKTPEDNKELFPEATDRGDEEVTKGPEVTNESPSEITSFEDEVTKTPEETKESLPEITQPKDHVTKTPNDGEESKPEVTGQEEDITRRPYDTKEPISEVTGSEEEVTKVPEIIKETLPEDKTHEEGTNKSPEDEKESQPEVTGDEKVTEAPEYINEIMPEVTRQEEITKAPEHAEETVSDVTSQEQEVVTGAPEETEESLPEITSHEEEVTKAPEKSNDSLPEITGNEEEITKAPEVVKESVPEITQRGEDVKEVTGQEEEITKAPEVAKESLPESTTYEGEVTKAPEETKESVPEITQREEDVTKAPEDVKESQPEVTGQEEEITKAPEVTKESLPEITSHEEEVTKAPEETKESVPEITQREEDVTKAPEDVKVSQPDVTGQEEEITKAPEVTKESLPESTSHEEEVTKAPEETKEPLPEITRHEEGVTKAPEETKESAPDTTQRGEDVTQIPEDVEVSQPEVTEQEEEITKAPEVTKESLPQSTSHEEEVTKAPEETKEPVSEIITSEEEITKAPEETKESLPEMTPFEEEVTKAPEDVKESQPEDTEQEEVTKSPDDKNELAPAVTQHEDVTKVPGHMEESLPEVPSPVEETTNAPEEPNELIPEITGYATEVTKAPQDTKEMLPEVTVQEEVTPVPQDVKESVTKITDQNEEEFTKRPEDTEELRPEVTGHHDGVTRSPEETEESLDEVTKHAEEVTVTPEDKKESVPESTGLDKEVTKATEEKVTKTPEDTKESEPEEVTEKQEPISTIHEGQHALTETTVPEVTTSKQVPKLPEDQFSETTPQVVILEEHTHRMEEEITTISPVHEVSEPAISSEKPTEERIEFVTKETETSTEGKDELLTVPGQTESQTTLSSLDQITERVPTPSIPTDETASNQKLDEFLGDKATTMIPTSDKFTTAVPAESESPVTDSILPVQTEKIPEETEQPVQQEIVHKTTIADEEVIATTKATTTKQEEEIVTPVTEDKPLKPEEKPVETSETTPSTATPESPKPIAGETQPTDEVSPPEDDSHFPPSGGYGEPDYVEEDQAFGPGTCRYGGKVYVSAQQIPRDDPCDFCFCFRSDIICLQQSCPPPIHGCHEEPIQGFCCPRYECPVSMATTVNVTTTTTTTTTTLPPHFPTHSYKGAAQRRGCQIKGHTYKVGEVVRSSSGPCLHCTCGGDGQMKCDPKACTPEPMLRQMIAAAVSAKRRR